VCDLNVSQSSVSRRGFRKSTNMSRDCQAPAAERADETLCVQRRRSRTSEQREGDADMTCETPVYTGCFITPVYDDAKRRLLYQNVFFLTPE